jgi:ribosomal-protein-alanine N-acetyltransferase
MTAIDRVCFPPGIAFPRELFADCLAHSEFQGWGVEAEGRLVAFSVLCYAGPRVAHIITIDVLPDYRRLGIADALMGEIERSARERRLRRMVLQVEVENPEALALYRKWNYQPKSILPDYYGPGLDAFMMDKLLSA